MTAAAGEGAVASRGAPPGGVAARMPVACDATPGARAVGRLGALVEATKPRITRLVTITSMVGFALVALRGGASAAALAWAMVAAAVGTAFSAAGANALNQWAERARDARMARTERRPLPSGRLTPRAVLCLGLGLSAAGVAVLWLGAGMASAAVSLATIVTYVWLYTPMKPVTPWATWIGAVPGALPPVIGWCAAWWAVSGVDGWGGLWTWGAASLFGLMYVWQIPHFLAIAWMYREDYARGGYKVLAVLDPSGARTSRHIVGWAALFVPTAMAPAWVVPGLGVVYAVIAGLTGVGFAWLAVKAARTRAREDARRVFLASVMHLPLLLLAMVGEAAVRAAL